MCGILGLLLNDPKAQACSDLFEGLGYLQHRGQVTFVLVQPIYNRMLAGS